MCRENWDEAADAPLPRRGVDGIATDAQNTRPEQPQHVDHGCVAAAEQGRCELAFLIAESGKTAVKQCSRRGTVQYD